MPSPYRLSNGLLLRKSPWARSMTVAALPDLTAVLRGGSIEPGCGIVSLLLGAAAVAGSAGSVRDCDVAAADLNRLSRGL